MWDMIRRKRQSINNLNIPWKKCLGSNKLGSFLINKVCVPHSLLN
uniref:Uncharacterized protein n=1 Tax=Rhizophora mucronata TaxID=61149 RepID=A0A2P2PAZ8_RHIMU